MHDTEGKENCNKLPVHDRNAILLFDELKIRRDLVYNEQNDIFFFLFIGIRIIDLQCY